MRFLILLAFSALAWTGCGGSESSSSGSGGAGAGGSGGASGSTGPSGSTGTGGGGMCGVGKVWVVPCCGGPAPLCTPLPDGGMCPPGTSPGTCGDGTRGCVDSGCQAPPPYCADEADLSCSGQSCSISDCGGSLQDGVLYCECA